MNIFPPAIRKTGRSGRPPTPGSSRSTPTRWFPPPSPPRSAGRSITPGAGSTWSTAAASSWGPSSSTGAGTGTGTTSSSPETPYGVLRERLIHYTHRSIDEFVRKSSRYATWGAEKYLRQGRRGRSAAIFGHAAFNFIRNYLFRLGFLDGTPGLIVAMLSSYYVAEKWAKLWELEQNPKK